MQQRGHRRIRQRQELHLLRRTLPARCFGNATTFRSDSISYSFALDELSITNTTLNVVVKVIGTPVDYDRPYDIELISDQTNAISTAWDESILSNRSIKQAN